MLMDETAVAAFIQQFSFGALVTADLNISHLPFFFRHKRAKKRCSMVIWHGRAVSTS
jgi:predicted FMN-binding regulatory protein PaiB